MGPEPVNSQKLARIGERRVRTQRQRREVSAGVAPDRCARRQTPRPRGRRCGRARAGAGCSAAAGWGRGEGEGRGVGRAAGSRPGPRGGGGAAGAAAHLSPPAGAAGLVGLAGGWGAGPRAHRGGGGASGRRLRPRRRPGGRVRQSATRALRERCEAAASARGQRRFIRSETAAARRFR